MFHKSPRIISFMAGLLCLLLGMLFYLGFRGYLLSPDFPTEFFSYPKPDGVVFDCFPSFIHALALMFLAVAVGMMRKQAFYVVLSMGVIFEFYQLISGQGTFDLRDVFASCLGTLAGVKLTPAMGSPSGVSKKFLRFVILFFGVFSSLATSYGPKTGKMGQNKMPMCFGAIYLSYDAMRDSFAVEAPMAGAQFNGKMSLSGNRLIVGEYGQGIHIFDYSNPSAPVFLYFLKIPGNTDFVMKNNILYADSFVDLITISLDGTIPALISREYDVFEWNPGLLLGQEWSHNQSQFDKTKGVVVGFRSECKIENPNVAVSRNRISLYGNKLYVNATSNLVAFELSQDGKALSTGTTVIDGALQSIAHSGSSLVLTIMQKEAAFFIKNVVYSLEDPDHPLERGVYVLGDQIGSVHASTATAFLASDAAADSAPPKLTAINLSEMGHPSEISSSTFAGLQSFDLTGSRLFVCSDSEGLQEFSIDQVKLGQPWNSLNQVKSAQCGAIAIADDQLVLKKEGSIQLYDLSQGRLLLVASGSLISR